ncbi:hypothetical protein ACP275_04G074700 [Erythranthe tilingii]
MRERERDMPTSDLEMIEGRWHIFDLEKKKSKIKTKDSKSGAQKKSKKNEHVTDIYSEYELYQASKSCSSLDDFVKILDRASAAERKTVHEILLTATPAGNTCLHVAAKHANEDVVDYVRANYPPLLLTKNSNGETALHLAAKAGHGSIVTALVQINRHSILLRMSQRSEEAEKMNNLVRATNERGNTALHEALIHGWDSVAQYLIQYDPVGSYILNKKGESAFYLAAKAGFANCFQGRYMDAEFKENFPIRAAMEGKSKEVLELMYEHPSIMQSRDVEGRTPFPHAASLGYLEVVRDLLKHYTFGANERNYDESGSLPIHLASKGGHLGVVELLLQHSYDAEELLDNSGRNILHVAAENGRYNIVSYVLKDPGLENLINTKDKHGSTPLHLATTHWHPKIVSALTWDKRVDIESVDDKGMTALDTAECHMSDNPPFRQRLTWAPLVAAGTPRSMSGKTIRRQTSIRSSNLENYKDRVNTLLLVATLVATVTFAAGFTLPGGYNSSDTDLAGMATMIKHKGFHLFIFCDTIAMYSSIVVVVALIWGQLGDLALVINVLMWALPLLGIALTMMSMAFMAGVLLVVSKIRWLSTIVLVIGIPFLVILSVLLFPLCTPFTSRNPVLRYVSYYSYYLVLLAISNEPTD